MVAVVSGNGLGLFTTSLAQLGLTAGGPSIGGSRTDQYVNLATGNLILTGWDESLFGHGFATGLVRTYNSQGSFSQVGADGWQTDYERTVRLASGTQNTVGSKVERATADGSVVAYTWDAARNAYVSLVGDGAHDTIVLSGTGSTAKWLWTEGSSQVQEIYAASNLTAAGRLEKIADLATDANYTLNYSGALLQSVIGTNGEVLAFGYDAQDRLVSLSTSERNAGGTLVNKGQVSYGYDAAGRLSWVQTDLTPENALDNTWDSSIQANNDGKSYRVTYTYADSSSLRITGVATSDGITVAYAYDGAGRIVGVTQGGVADGSAQSLTYTYATGSTTVTDGAGRSWTYQYDAAGQLTAVLEPAIAGQRAVTEYSYDASGNVVRIRQAAYAGAASTLDTVYQYDANGNVILQRDLLGNTVVRTYSSENRILTETRYTVPDADGLDPAHAGTFNVPDDALVTRYIYDIANPRLLRFVIDAVGGVSETQYNASGVAQGLVTTTRRFVGAAYGLGGTPTLAQMESWASTWQAQAVRSDFHYDPQGRLSQRVEYAAVDTYGVGVLDDATSITRYTYDAQGLLRQQVAVHGVGRTVAGAVPGGSEVVDYVYDGLGRLLSTIRRSSETAANDDANTITTTVAYVDSSRRVVTTLDSGLVRTEVRNAAGLLLSLSEAGTVGGSPVTRTTQNVYDAAGHLRAVQDATGGFTYFFYDAAGRLSATVDATGAVTTILYDGIGRVSGGVSYATRVVTTGWYSAGAVTKDTLVYSAGSPALLGNQAWVQIDASNDRMATRTYDAAGRLASQTDAAGLVTVYAYDGAGRLLSSTAIGDGTSRVQRFFYDAADRLVATLDAGGFLAEMTYDVGGRLAATKRYAIRTNSAYWTSGTLDQLRPAADAANDQIERFHYDGRGNQVGRVDAEGYFTEFVYDEKNNQRAVKAYAKQLTGLSGSESLASLRASALSGAPAESFRLTLRSFNGLGQLVAELNPEGTVTRYSYDEAGRLVRTEAGQGTSEVRENYVRYDAFGQLIGEMSGQQAAAAAAALGKSLNDSSLSEAQRENAYAQYGVRHSYDLVGRRTESIDASGAKTFYFYDAAGRQTYVVRGVKDAYGNANAQGEVTETRYTAFGQVSEELAYTGRIAIPQPGSRASVQNAITTLGFVAAIDSRRQYAYDQRGLLTQSIDAEGGQVAMRYNAFGQLSEQTTAYGTGQASTTTYAYNPRGLLNARTEAYGTALARTSNQSFDAFGRVATVTDALGTVTTLSYDRIGRQVGVSRTVSGQVESTTTTYDAFGRVASQTDARGNVTAYTHSDNARSLMVTTPEGVSITTVHNRFGQVVTVSQVQPGGGMATTTTTYDKNGAVVSILDPLGNAVDNVYNDRGLLAETTDANGRKVQYTYDAVGRLLARVEDPGAGKLNLSTTYAYDGQGRQLEVTDASGRLTKMSYDREGRLTQIAKDPNGLNLRTVMSYDAAGRVLTVTEGYGTSAATTVEYAYDALNRRIAETVDPGAGKLNLTTQYAYDANDNLVARTDALCNVTRYAYDKAGRLRFVVDAAGALVETVYDKNGNAILTREFAKALSAGSMASLGVAPTVSALLALVSNESLQNDAADCLAYQVFDRDNRVRFTLDAVGGLAETRYDSAGRVQQTLSYGTAFADTSILSKLRAGTATVGDFTSFASANESAARANQLVYDAAGRVVYVLTRSDVGAVVSERRYDASGLKIADVAYAATIAYVAGQTAAQVASAVAAAGGNAANQQRLTRYAYDGAGRLRFAVDDAGAVTEQRYDGAGRVTSTHAYATPVAAATMTEAAVAALVTGQTNVRRTGYAYDSAGRLASTTDALNKTESYGYDAANRRTSVTNKLGAVWTYEYDAAGRMTVERSPAVSVARYDASGNVVVDTTSIVTRRTYDALGQVLTVTENADTAEARTISYQYDARGRQVRTIFPDAWQLDASGTLVATGTQPDVRVTYDAQDRAVVQKDVRDNYSYKVYDSQGRLAYDIDQTGYVTAYAYDAYGEQVGLTRYANRIDTTKLAGWSAGQAITLAQMAGAGVLTASADDRTLTTAYDRLGRKIAITQPSIAYYKANGTLAAGTPATQFVYDTYGNLVRERQLLEGTPGQADAVWADTFHYYDELGRRIRTVDAEGYVTAWQYDALGQVGIQIEFARKIATAGLTPSVLPPLPAAGDATTGYDRSTLWQYDLLGRKVKESAARLYQTAAGANATRTVDTAFAYDAEGRLLTTLVDGVMVSGIAYDALGRTVSTTEAEHKVLRSDWQSLLANNAALDLSSAALYVDAAPYITMEYDAFGNALRVVRYAAGDPASGAPDAGDAANAVTTVRYDRQGRAVVTRDAVGTFWYSRYDAADNIVDTWYTLSGTSGGMTVHTVASYDAVGQQLTSFTTRTPLAGGQSVTDAQSAVAYNAFGEIVAQGAIAADLASASTSARYFYDRAGRIIASNAATGANRSYFYDLAGRQVREERPWTDGTTAATAVYLTKSDKLGRVIAQILPSWKTDATATAQVSLTLDRWGNVLSQVDVRGNLTRYVYNDRDQVIRQIAPSVKVIDETGGESWQTPETRWMYDALGRLIATQDANGHVRRYEYDAAGRQVRATDATGAVSRKGYDALGREVAAQNAVGYLTYVDYDKLDRAIAQGDFLPGGAGRTRTALQTYYLNQNGDRWQVTDATNVWTKYDYDSRGLMVRSQTSANVVRVSAYDVQGRKISETIGSDSNTWAYDYFGRLTDHVDLGGSNYDYVYDGRSGLLTAVTGSQPVGLMASPGEGGGGVALMMQQLPPDDELPGIDLTQHPVDRRTEYYANGLVKLTTDGPLYYYYEYDAAGNRILEETRTVDGSGNLVHTITRTTYDSHNRLIRVTNQDIADGGRYTLDLSYDYDAVGNRRRVVANSAYGSNASPLDPTNQAPTVAAPIPDQIAAATGSAWSYTVPGGTFTDPDNDALTYTANGMPAWMTFDPVTRTFSGMPKEAGNWSITVIARDPSGAAVTGTFAVTTPNVPPAVANPIPDQTVSANQAWSYTVPAGTFIDRNDQTLSYTASGAPGWLQLDTLTGTFYGTSPASGTWSITVTASDGSLSASDTFTVTIGTPSNRSPVVAAPIPDQVAPANGGSWSYTFPAGAFTDPENDALIYTASGMPAWMTFDPATRTFSGIPQAVGSWSVSVIAQDPQGANAIDTFMVTTPGVAPIVVNPIPDQTANVGQAWSYTIPADAFQSSNGQSLEYSVEGAPAWLNFNRDTRTFSGLASAPGNWSITVTASDGGLSVSDTFVLAVVAPNKAPVVATPIPDQGAAAWQAWSYTFPAGTFSDPDGNALTYTASGMPAWMAFNANTRTFSGTPTAGNWDITVTAQDPSGATVSDTFAVIVAQGNRPPEVTVPIPDQSATVGQAWSYTFPLLAFTDPDGWMTGYTVSGMPGWMWFDSAERTFGGTPTVAGTYTLVVTGHDSSGDTVTDSFVLTVSPPTNHAPIVSSPIPDQSGTAGQAWSYMFPAGTFSDPDGNSLTYTASGMPAWMAFNAGTRTFSGTPSSAGSWSVTVTAHDPSGATVSDTFVVTAGAGNVAPVVANPIPGQSANVGSAWTYTIPANTFTDANGDTLTYDAYEWALVSDPLGGGGGMQTMMQPPDEGEPYWTEVPLPAWLSFNAATRTFTGMPQTQGDLQIIVWASDGRGGAASSLFTLTVNPAPNRAPVVATSIPDQSGTAGQAWSYTFPAGTFSDPDGNALTYTASGMPAWMAFNANTRTFSGTPTAGNWSITVTAQDPSGATVSDTFVVSVASGNQAPVVSSPIPDQSATMGAVWTYTIPANTFADANGDALSYEAWEWTLVNSNYGALMLPPDDPGDPGDPGSPYWTEIPLPAWLSFNAATRTFSGTPPVQGGIQLKVWVYDGRGGAVSDMFTLNITAPVNRAPVVSSPIPDQIGMVGWSTTYSFPTGTFSDPDGNALTYTASGMPSWMSFNASSRTFTGTPTAVGSWNITVTAGDPSGATVSDTFTYSIIAAPNQAPVVSSPIPDQSATNGQAWSYTFPAGTFSDPDGNPLTYTASGTPPWLNFNASTRKFSGSPTSPGVWDITVTARDPSGATATDTFSLTVNPPANQAPVVSSPIQDQNTTAGQAWSYAFPASTFTDPDGNALTYSASGMPAWMAFNANTRTFSGTPTAGSWSVTVTAQDPSGATASDTFVVTAAAGNQTPVVSSPIPDQSATAGQAWSYAFPAGTFSDPDGNALAYTASGLPAWMAFNAGARTFSGTPSSAGSWSVTVTAQDPSGATVSDVFVVTVTGGANRAPYVNRPLEDQYEFLHYTFAADTFMDPDGDTLTYTYSVSPVTSQIYFDGATRTFDGSPPGGKYGKVYTITVTASDGRGQSVSDSFFFHAVGYMEPLGGGGQPQTSSSPSNDLYSALSASALQVELDQQALPPPDPEDPDPPGGGGGGTPPPPVPNVQTLWFSYDAENRVQVVNGALVNGQIVVAAKQANSDAESYALHYDAAGHAVNRTTVTSAGVTQVAQSAYSLRGELSLEYAKVDMGQATGVVARHVYDAAGREIELTEYFAPGTIKNYRTGNPKEGEQEYVDVDVSGWRSRQTVTSYDTGGRVSQVSELGRGASRTWLMGTPDPALIALSNVFYSTSTGASGYNTAGMLVTYRYQSLTGTYTHTYTTTYEKRETYLEKSVTGTSTDSNYRTTTTSSVYDQMGRRVKITQTTPVSGQTPLTQTRSFSFNASGGILTRSDSGVKQHYVYANGQQVATLGADGKIDAVSQLTAFDSSRMGAEPAMVLEGDTLQSIAQRVYGNSSLWYVLAAANAVTDAELVAGSTLKVPSVKTTANDATTFKPFDPNEVQGATTPSLPYIAAPPKKHCSAIASVIRIVVAVIVTVITRNPQAGWSVGTTVAAAMGVAAVGETAAQSVEIHQGVRSGYDWGGVALSAVSAGFGASTAAANFAHNTNAFVHGAVMAGASNLAGYAVRKALGQDVHFSMRGLVSDTLAGGISGSLFGRSPTVNGAPSGAIAGTAFSWSKVTLAAVQSVARQGINYGVHDAIEGHAHWSNGQVLGSALLDAATTAAGTWAYRKSGDAGRAGTAETYPLGPDGNPVSTMPLPQRATGGVATSGYVSEATIRYGDRVRSNAISVSPVGGYRVGAYERGARNLSSVVVTADPAQNAWYMSLWDWSNRYNMAPPPVTTNRAALVQYWSDGNKALGPAYATYLKNAYQGQTVSLAGGKRFMTNAEFEQQWRTTGVNGVLGRALGAADNALAAGQQWFHGLVEGVNEFGNTTTSTGGRMFAAAEYAVIQTVDKVASGALGGLRLITNQQMGAAAIQGGISIVRDPLGTAERGWAEWSAMSFQEKAEHAAAMVVGLPLLLEAGASQAAQIGRLSERIGDWGDFGVANSASRMSDLARLRSELRVLDTSEFSTAQKGVLGESRASLVYRRAGYQELDARLTSNNGFDGVFVKYGVDGNPVDIIINESKFTSTGRASLSNTNMGQQMSPRWIDANIEKMMGSSNSSVMETGYFLDANRSLIRTKINVLNTQGVNHWNVLYAPR